MGIRIKGERLKEVRKMFHFSQTNLGNELGISKQAVSDMEKKKEVVVNEDRLCKIEKFLNCSRQYLTGETNTWNEVPYEDKILSIPLIIDPYVAPATKIIRSADKNRQELMLFILREYEKYDNLKPELVKTAIPFIFDFIVEADITKLESLIRIAKAM